MNKKFPSTHHWCDEGIITWYELACAIRDMSEEIGLIKNPAYVKRIKTKDLKLKAIRPKYSVLDCTKTEELLDTKLINWRESLLEILLKLKSSYS